LSIAAWIDLTDDSAAVGKPIVKFQAIQLKLSERAIKGQSARLLIWRAVQS
jgi:alkylation response protein AidB-like acyl-CoA dehydrogenase